MVAETENFGRRPANRLPLENALGRHEAQLYARIPAEVDYVSHPSFSRASTEQKLFGPGVASVEVPAWTQFPEVPDEEIPHRSARKSLRADDEVRLFLSMNYATYRLGKLVEMQNKRATVGRAKEMVLWFRRVLDARATLVRANLALVLAMAKRTRIQNVEFSDLISEGNMALLRAVEKFDVSRGFKFSTYACRAILKGFSRMATNTGRYRSRFPVEFDPTLEPSDEVARRQENDRTDSIEAVRYVLSSNSAKLSQIERTVVMERFALGGPEGGKGRTLNEVGRMVGLTNERVRQIQIAALGKIRAVLDEDHVAV